MNIREKTCVLLFEKSKIPYAFFFKRHKKPWGINAKELKGHCIENTLGWALGNFLDNNQFDLIPRLERHDAYHVLTGFGTTVKDEIALQYLCFGNGKRSKYLFIVMIMGTLLNPEHWRYFRDSYRKGKDARKFYHWNFKNYLHRDLKELKNWVFDKSDISAFWRPVY